MSERETVAVDLLQSMLEGQEGALTPGVAIELAKMLAHIAGGDGRGVYQVVHHAGADPATIQPPVTAFDLAPLVLAQREAYDTAEEFREQHQIGRPSERLIEWAEWVLSVDES